MKKQILFTLLLLFSITIKAQPTVTPDWMFHIAFEDASGARDTVFFILDSTASDNYIDTVFGEIGMSMPNNVFQVYFQTGLTDSSKYEARPLNALGISAVIYASNVQYPLIARWDTSLFSSAILPAPYRYATLDNEYFFLVNNWGGHQYYNMTTVDTAYMPVFSWGSHQHFPLFFQADRVTNTVNINNPYAQPSVVINPNVIADGNVEVKLTSLNKIKCIDIYNCAMQLTKSIQCETAHAKITTNTLPKGIYFLKITDQLNNKYYGKIIKS